jgi:site-specific DNA-methyltransferase (cytosine-N4-specific)
MTPAFHSPLGKLFIGRCETVLKAMPSLKGKVQLLLTSPPFPLKRKKKYGNLEGDKYLEWLTSLAPTFADLLTPDGSLVVEIGNAWEAGKPIQSLLPMKALLAFVENPEAKLKLCQEFVCYNPARLPSPAQWVTIDRIRVKDSFTRVWWMSTAEKPEADNKRVLKEYSKSMEELLARRGYNAGARPSEHVISETGFLKKHKGAIPPNVIESGEEESDIVPTDLIEAANTGSNEGYQQFCRDNGLSVHPARMPFRLAEFFIKFLTKPGQLVLDPFAGSNTVGYAAESLGRRWVAIEADDDYALASIARFDREEAKELLVYLGMAEAV